MPISKDWIDILYKIWFKVTLAGEPIGPPAIHGYRYNDNTKRYDIYDRWGSKWVPLGHPHKTPSTIYKIPKEGVNADIPYINRYYGKRFYAHKLTYDEYLLELVYID